MGSDTSERDSIERGELRGENAIEALGSMTAESTGGTASVPEFHDVEAATNPLSKNQEPSIVAVETARI